MFVTDIQRSFNSSVSICVHLWFQPEEHVGSLLRDPDNTYVIVRATPLVAAYDYFFNETFVFSIAP